MSSCLILQDKDRLFIGADSALVLSDNESFVRIDETREKIFHIYNSLIFCSGNIFLVEKTIDFIKTLLAIDVDKISEFLKSLNFKKNKNIFNIELIICIKNKDIINVFQISEYNSFDIVKNDKVEKDVRILAGGIETKKCLDISTEKLINGVDVKNIFVDTYNRLSCEKIGGVLKVWEISDDIKVFYEGDICDYRNVHSLVAETVVGNLIAGNQLTITNEASTFTVDATGVSMTNGAISVNQDNSKIYIDPDKGIQIDKYIGGAFDKTVFSVDSAGNAIFAGELSAATGTFSGALSAATGTFSGDLNASGGTFSGDISAATGNFSGGLDAATGTFSGDISGANGTFTGTIRADKLYGLVSYGQLTDIPANQITSGTMSGNRVDGGTIDNSTIRWSGGYLGLGTSGAPELVGYGNLTVKSNNGSLLGLGSTASLYSPGVIQLEGGSLRMYGGTTFYSSVTHGSITYFNGSIYAGGNSGDSRTVTIYDYNNVARSFVFTYGILTSYY